MVRFQVVLFAPQDGPNLVDGEPILDYRLLHLLLFTQLNVHISVVRGQIVKELNLLVKVRDGGT